MPQDLPQTIRPTSALARLGLGVVCLALVAGCTTSDSAGTDKTVAPPSASPSPTTGPTGTTDATTEPPATPEPTLPPMPGAIPDQDFSYDEAYAAWQDGMPYYDAFCIHYEPTTPAGESQCEGIENGTVDSVTGESIEG